jgi:hypothetical protein
MTRGELSSGIHSEALLDTDPPRFRVEWIDWDSGFRDGGLQLGDGILGAGGRPMEPFLEPGQLSKGVGQHGESGLWDDLGAEDGQTVVLSVLRDGATVEVTGTLHAPRFYKDAEGKPALAPGGPTKMATDGFDGAWAGWLEKIVWKFSYILVRGWEQRSFNSRRDLAEMMDHRARIEYLLQKHPGPFADTMRADWEQVLDCCRGKKLDAIDLEYRELGEKRLQTAQREATAAWDAFRQELAEERAEPFPVPEMRERAKVVGKVVELPPITERNILNDLGTAFAAIGSSTDGYYFLPMETPDLFRFWNVLSRYKGQINPSVPGQYRFVGRVLDAPQLITVGGRPQVGLTIQLIAVLAGADELFVDLRRDPPAFAGEEKLSSFPPIAPDPSAPPERVIEAMIQAIKVGDQKAWRSLFADWRVAGAGGHEKIEGSYVPGPAVFTDAWERSRRNITKGVLDARVGKVEPVRRILARDTGDGLPDVDQAVVWVDHYGEFEGEYRSFVDISVNRGWTLQRLDEGPWMIVSVQSL